MTKSLQAILRKKSLLGSYLVILFLMVVGVSFSVYTSAHNSTRMQQIIQTNDYHLSLISRIHTAARERIITLYKMTLEEDPFVRDELFLVFNEKGTDYIATRNELLAAGISDRLRKLLQEQDKVTQPLGNLNKIIADLIMEDRMEEARDIFIHKAAPLQDKIFSFFKRMNATVEEYDRQAMQEANNYRKWSERVVLLMATVIILFMLRVAFRSIKHEVRTENNLRLEKRISDVTLRSIPDGVILCDNHGLITDINAVAESMLGTRREGRIHSKFTTLIAELIGKDESEVQAPDTGDINKLTFRQADNTLREVEYSINDILLDEEPAGRVIVLHDVTEINKLTRRLIHQAGHDELTGLHNRRDFERLLDETINISRRQSDIDNWLCYIDVDKFKDINDTYGHKAGDQVLISVADCIRECVRTTDYIARIGGDEFTVILRYCNYEEARATTERMLSEIASKKTLWNGKKIDVSASIGLVEITSEDHDQSELTSRADNAMYEAKRNGRNRLHIHHAAA